MALIPLELGLRWLKIEVRRSAAILDGDVNSSGCVCQIESIELRFCHIDLRPTKSFGAVAGKLPRIERADCTAYTKDYRPIWARNQMTYT